MTDLRKAAEMALDALEIYGAQAQAVKETIEALRKALAQPEQEPVAWIDTKEPRSDEAFRFQQTEHHTQPLYTAPPKREWVEPTDEEIYKILNMKTGDAMEIAKALLAKAKEKNFGSAD